MILQVPEGIPYRGRGHWAIAVLVILCVATIAIVGLRLYSRLKILKQSKLGWTDWCIIVATASMLVYIALQILGTSNYGLGIHMTDFHKLFSNDHDYLEAYITMWRTAYIQRFLYELSTCLIKLSILLFLYTLSPYRSFQFLIYILIFLDVVSSLITITILFFQCTPLSTAFLPHSHRPPGSCWSYGSLVLCEVIPVCNTVLDATCWLIPMHLAWQASDQWKERFRIAVVLCMGFTAVIASVVRIVFLEWLRKSGDTIWYYWDISLWAMIELAMGITCACCPALMPIIRLINRKIRGPDSAQRSSRKITAIRRDLGNIEVELHSGPSIRKFGHTSTGTNSNHENILGIGTLQHQNGDSFHAVGTSGRAYCASTEAFANTGSTGGSLSRISTVALSLETVDPSLHHERSIADVELGNSDGR